MPPLRLPTDAIPKLGLTLGDFWSWAYSDVLNNRNRAIFAEYIVGVALGQVDSPRVEWDAVDFKYHGGVEVKSAAFLQSWNIGAPVLKLSAISFDIGEKLGWDSGTNTSLTEAKRSAACYVFCLYSEKDPTKVDPLDLAGWEFFVVATSRLNAELGQQKRIGIERLKRLCSSISYDKLRQEVDRVLDSVEAGNPTR
jgi:hypothetical protein